MAKKTTLSQLETDLREARAMIRILEAGAGKESSPKVAASALARWRATVKRVEAELAKRAGKVLFSSQVATEDFECLECGRSVDRGRLGWWQDSAEGSCGPFCTRRCARLLAQVAKVG